MEAHWIWWLAAVVLVIAEMLTGTFYLIAIASGLAAAGVSAFLGVGGSLQALIAALLCSASVAVIYKLKQGRTGPGEQQNLAYDIGQSVRVVSWSGERKLRVSYRGAEWDAELAESVAPDSRRQAWRIRKVVGSLLIVE